MTEISTTEAEAIEAAVAVTAAACDEIERLHREVYATRAEALAHLAGQYLAKARVLLVEATAPDESGADAIDTLDALFTDAWTCRNEAQRLAEV